MIRLANPTFKRDVILFTSQSNGIHPVNLLTDWPARERFDANSRHACPNTVGNWGEVRYTPLDLQKTHGCLVNSLAARMRDRGMLPVFIHYGASGSHSDYWYTNRAAIAAYMAARLAELQQPTVRALLHFQGETDAMDGPGTSWQSNITGLVSSIRTAVSLPTLPLILVNISSVYTTWTYLAQVRAGVAALAAADGHATVIEPDNPTRVFDNIHLDQPALGRLAVQIVNAL